MTAFNKAWNLVKEEDDTRLENALVAARMRPKRKKPLELPGYVRSGSAKPRVQEMHGNYEKADDLPMPEEKPFKMRKPGGCDHNFVVTDEDMVGDTLYRTYTCTKCGESMTSSPS